MAEYSVDDFVMTALKGYVDVEKAKVGARLGATGPLQDQGLSSAAVPRDPQAASKSYTSSPDKPSPLLVLGGVVVGVVLLGALIARVGK